jgi:endonuclease G
VYTGPLFLPRPETKEEGVYALANINIQFDQERIKVVKGQKDKYKMEYNVIGSAYPNIAVPTHFYKILLVTTEENDFALGAFVLPNQAINSKTPLENFQVNLRAIEKASGLVFFELLNRKEFGNLCSLIHCNV